MKYFIEDSTLTDIGNAIREKEGTTELIPTPDMGNRIRAIPSGGDTSVEDAIVDRSIIEYKNDRVTKVGYGAFSDCTLLTTVDLPNVKSIGYSAFNGCSALTTVNLPNATTVEYNAFYNCTSLATIDLPKATSVSDAMFSNCTALNAVILRSTTKATLSNASAFAGTGIESGIGYIYVPKALIEDYKESTNWSVYAEQFRAIEDYPEIGESEVAE